ncbi:hypothetical protein Bxe_B1960 [Paraburkholderia xenovorans LB400]|uniref:Uncharacterized protein n=1 Tax=Paraburkholderia xenovorans (strain LB400) TaxID=266265 RepID=Q13PG7_PARXL|nr:hypothetical protein Bxe_B1960 [Paraburkholderia xenovorans LB400]
MVCGRADAPSAPDRIVSTETLAEGFLRQRTRPSEQRRGDWDQFSHVEIGYARGPLLVFVIVLPYSRDIYSALSSLRRGWRTSCVATSARSVTAPMEALDNAATFAPECEDVRR